ncbi:MAG: hypothetical protein V4510_10995 [bacterium]
MRSLACLLLGALLVAAAPAQAVFTVTLTAPPSPVAPGASTTFTATFALDCQTALQWSAASNGVTKIPVTAVAKGTTSTLVVSGPTALELDVMPCTTPSASPPPISVAGTYTISPNAHAPALVDLSTYVHGSVPQAAVSGNVVVAAQSDNRTVKLQVTAILLLSVESEKTMYDVGTDPFDFNATFRNRGNIALNLVFNSTTQASIDMPSLYLGAVGDPQPANVTGKFRFHAPPAGWQDVTAHIVITPQVQTFTGALLGTPATLDLKFHNAMPAKKSPEAIAPLIGVLLLGLAAVSRRRK